MAKTKVTETDIAVIDRTPTTPAVAELEALRAAGIDLNDTLGKDQIDNKNLVLPFLAVTQKPAPQLEEGPKYVEGLRFLDLFNTLTGEVFGRGPIAFVVLALREHAIEFNPFDEGGGVKDRNVPLSDPRCKFDGDNKPIATTFCDYVVLLEQTRDVIVLSFKGASLRNGRILKTLTKNPALPLYAQRYTVQTEKAEKNGNTYAVLLAKPAGAAKPDLAIFAKKTLQSLAEKNIVIEHEAEVVEGDEIPF